jgi:hypothetical protein
MCRKFSRRIQILYNSYANPMNQRGPYSLAFIEPPPSMSSFEPSSQRPKHRSRRARRLCPHGIRQATSNKTPGRCDSWKSTITLNDLNRPSSHVDERRFSSAPPVWNLRLGPTEGDDESGILHLKRAIGWIRGTHAPHHTLISR